MNTQRIIGLWQQKKFVFTVMHVLFCILAGTTAVAGGFSLLGSFHDALAET